ncbi:MAG: T9SS type A sorting domain-containing protein [candidate division Zixibacteria bacterium]|nr:T9SS type A sorting domain-containing protein [candidate division Zixibacteria bacterium]
MFNTNIKAVMLISVLLITATAAYADYHYASHDGSDEPPYTSWETGAHLIQDAADAASRGDTIYVGEGTWYENVDISDTCVALMGMGIGNTILENYVYATVNTSGDSILVEGFTFISDWEIHATGGVHCAHYCYVVIKNNYFTGHADAVSGNFGGGFVTNNIFEYNTGSFRTFAVKDTLIFSNNTFINEHQFDNLIEDHLPDSSQIHIRNNVFYAGNWQTRIFTARNVADSVFIYNNLFYKKINLSDVFTSYYGLSHDKVHFYNNTIDGATENNPESPIAGICSEMIFDSVRTIDNNIVINCDKGILNRRYFSANIRYCNLFNNEYDIWGECEFIEGNIFTDPMLTDTIGFYLQSYSQAIDAGDPDILDLDGSISDIGAYGGPYGEFYEYQDLPPRVPDSLQAEIPASNDAIIICWHYNTESDFNRYQLHRDTISEFEPSVFNMIAEPETSVYIDTEFDVYHSYYYRISAIDNQDNISEYSEQIGVIFTGFDDFNDTIIPRMAVLHQNYPNPFNQNTIIRYYLPNVGYQPAEVELYIYDILGRQVRQLVNERRYPGEYEVIWDGRDDNGQSLSSGVYFYRMFVTKAELTRPRKLILLK